MSEPDRGGCGLSMTMIVGLVFSLLLGAFLLPPSVEVPTYPSLSPNVSFEVGFEVTDVSALETYEDEVIAAIVGAFRAQSFDVIQLRIEGGRIYTEVAGSPERIDQAVQAVIEPGVIPFVELIFASIGVLE